MLEGGQRGGLVAARYNFWQVITGRTAPSRRRFSGKIKARAVESPRLIKKSIHIFAFQDRASSAATESDVDKTWLWKERIHGEREREREEARRVDSEREKGTEMVRTVIKSEQNPAE